MSIIYDIKTDYLVQVLREQGNDYNVKKDNYYEMLLKNIKDNGLESIIIIELTEDKVTIIDGRKRILIAYALDKEYIKTKILIVSRGNIYDGKGIRLVHVSKSLLADHLKPTDLEKVIELESPKKSMIKKIKDKIISKIKGDTDERNLPGRDIQQSK